MNDYLIRIPALLIAITVHEFAHGYIANRMGDPTARNAGRLSLNPLRHLDIVGTLMLFLFEFGWAKPVPINSAYFSNPRKGMILTSLAGPASNLLTAALFVVPLRAGIVPNQLLSAMLEIIVVMNINFAVFNLVPLPPLDGSKILMGFLPYRQAAFLERWEIASYFLLFFLAWQGYLWTLIMPVVQLLYKFIFGPGMF